jgi:hypothetical protein
VKRPEKSEWHPTWLEKILLGIAWVCLVAWVFDHSFWFFFGMLFAGWGLHVLDQEHKREKVLQEAHRYEPENVYGDSRFVGDDELKGEHFLRGDMTI